MESDKEQARWLIKCVSDGRMTGGMAAEIEDYCFARRTELEKLTAERDHLRILYNTARDGMREVGELLETCRIELAESRAEVERLQGELEEAKLNEQLRGTTAYTRGQMLLSTLKQGGELAQRAEAAESTAAGLRRALEEARQFSRDAAYGASIHAADSAICDSARRAEDVCIAALAASPDEHARRIKAEALRKAAEYATSAAVTLPLPDHTPTGEYVLYGDRCRVAVAHGLLAQADRLEKEATNGNT